jgi:glycosyltransferase involved in cell wall biosynthesis
MVPPTWVACPEHNGESMSDKPLLSLVVAVYNGEKFLSAFFDSIKAQHLDSLELVVVDDGSSDNSAAIIAQYASEFPYYKVIEQTNQGVSAARNTGLAEATGEYVAFPDIDDVIYPGMYPRLLEMAKKTISMSPPVTAPIFTMTADLRKKSSRLTNCNPPTCWTAQPGFSARWHHVNSCTSPGLIFIATPLLKRRASRLNMACAIRIFRGRPKCC